MKSFKEYAQDKDIEESYSVAIALLENEMRKKELDAIPKDIDAIPKDIGDQIYPGSDEYKGDFPETDKLPVSPKILETIRFLAKALTYPIYGPVVYLIDKFIPTRLLIEVIKTLRMWGDDIVGDITTRRELKKALRQAVVNRRRIRNKEDVEAILKGDHDEHLDDILHADKIHLAWAFDNMTSGRDSNLDSPNAPRVKVSNGAIEVNKQHPQASSK